MSKIEKLITELGPTGVEYKKLGEVCEFKRGTTITQKDTREGSVPVVAGGQTPSYFHDTPNRNGETIAVSSSGAYAGFVSYWSIPVFLSDSFSVNPKSNLLAPKYVFHFLKNIQDKIHNTKKGGGVPHVHGSELAPFLIPVPPLGVQEEIVRILDKFTSLEAELEAELEGRKKQYNHYRDVLLSSALPSGSTTPNSQGSFTWRTLGEIGTFIRGNGLQKKDFTESGVGCIHYGQIYTFYGTAADKTKSFVSPALAKKLKKAAKGDLIIATTSENVEDVCKCVVWLGDEDICISGDSYVFKHNQNPKYIAYLFKTPQFMDFKRQNSTGTKVVRVHADRMEKFKAPLPSLEKQARIVAILDKFDALVNDLSVGLPAEIAARRKQYEYYRNKLLTFQKAA